MHCDVNSSAVACSGMSKSNMQGLHSLQGAGKDGMDGSSLFKELLQGVKTAGLRNRETLPSAEASCDENTSDLTAADVNKQTDSSEKCPAKVAMCDESQPAMESSTDSVPAIPEVSDASLVKVNVPRGLLKHIGGKKLSIPDSNTSPHTKKGCPREEQVETKTVASNSSLVTVSNTGTDASIVVVHQSIPSSRVALHAERNDANVLKAIPAGNAKEHQSIPMNMAAGASDRVPDLVLSKSLQSDVDVETETHDMEPVSSASAPHVLPTTVATVSVTMSDAATFRPFLLRSDRHTDVVMRPENDMVAAGPELPNQTVPAQPIKRLELQWNDSSLGKISLTAELRDGALHAVVDSSRAVSGVDATDLHRFLEDNRVPLHALQVNGQSTVSQTSRDPSWNSAATDVGAGMGGSQSFSHRGQEREGSSASEQRRTHSRVERYEGEMRAVEGSTAIPNRQSDQRLSIHI
jgi:hypothetical protein